MMLLLENVRSLEVHRYKKRQKLKQLLLNQMEDIQHKSAYYDYELEKIQEKIYEINQIDEVEVI